MDAVLFLLFVDDLLVLVGILLLLGVHFLDLILVNEFLEVDDDFDKRRHIPILVLLIPLIPKTIDHIPNRLRQKLMRCRHLVIQLLLFYEHIDFDNVAFELFQTRISVLYQFEFIEEFEDLHIVLDFRMLGKFLLEFLALAFCVIDVLLANVTAYLMFIFEQ